MMNTNRRRQKHVLGGRTFLVIENSTVEQDLFLERARREAGINDLMIEEGEAPEDFAERLLDTVVRSGSLLTLLGCLLMPEEALPKRTMLIFPAREGEAWTPEMAAETAAYIGGLQAPEEKAKVRILILDLLIHFFAHGTVYLRSTGTSSAPTTVPRGTHSPAGTDTVTGVLSS